MRLLNSLKSITWSLRLKIARLISKHDAQTSAMFGGECDRLVQEVCFLNDRLHTAEARGKDRWTRLIESERKLIESERKLKLANARIDEFTTKPAETFYNLLSKDEFTPSWDMGGPWVNLIIDKLIRPFHRSVGWGDRLLTLDKSMSFAKDATFREVFSQLGLIAYDQYNGPDSIAWRLNTLLWAAREVLCLDGDFVECGVFKGDMSYTIAKCLGFQDIAKSFYLYDSFEGLSPKYSSDADFPFTPGLLEVVNKLYRAPGIYENVCARFAEYSNFKIIKGFLPDSLAVACPEKIAFLHVDLNSPAAEVGTLEVLFDRVVPGGVVLFDDYGWIDFAPQKEAEDAFFAKRGYRVLELPTGQGLVLKR